MYAMRLIDGDPEEYDFDSLQQAALTARERLPPQTLRHFVHMAVKAHEEEEVAGVNGGGKGPSGSGAGGGGASGSADPLCPMCTETGKQRARTAPFVGSGPPEPELTGGLDEGLADGLSQLPDCVLLVVLGFLDGPSLATVGTLSRELRELAFHEALWAGLLCARFAPIGHFLPPGTLEVGASSSGARSSRELYRSLSAPGPGNWRMLAVSSAATAELCWIIIIDGGIYDVTSFMHRHPGGAA